MENCFVRLKKFDAQNIEAAVQMLNSNTVNMSLPKLTNVNDAKSMVKRERCIEALCQIVDTESTLDASSKIQQQKRKISLDADESKSRARINSVEHVEKMEKETIKSEEADTEVSVVKIENDTVSYLSADSTLPIVKIETDTELSVDFPKTEPLELKIENDDYDEPKDSLIKVETDTLLSGKSDTIVMVKTETDASVSSDTSFEVKTETNALVANKSDATFLVKSDVSNTSGSSMSSETGVDISGKESRSKTDTVVSDVGYTIITIKSSETTESEIVMSRETDVTNTSADDSKDQTTPEPIENIKTDSTEAKLMLETVAIGTSWINKMIQLSSTVEAESDQAASTLRPIFPQPSSAEDNTSPPTFTIEEEQNGQTSKINVLNGNAPMANILNGLIGKNMIKIRKEPENKPLRPLLPKHSSDAVNPRPSLNLTAQPQISKEKSLSDREPDQTSKEISLSDQKPVHFDIIDPRSAETEDVGTSGTVADAMSCLTFPDATPTSGTVTNEAPTSGTVTDAMPKLTFLVQEKNKDGGTSKTVINAMPSFAFPAFIAFPEDDDEIDANLDGATLGDENSSAHRRTLDYTDFQQPQYNLKDMLRMSTNKVKVVMRTYARKRKRPLPSAQNQTPIPDMREFRRSEEQGLPPAQKQTVRSKFSVDAQELAPSETQTLIPDMSKFGGSSVAEIQSRTEDDDDDDDDIMVNPHPQFEPRTAEESSAGNLPDTGPLEKRINRVMRMGVDRVQRNGGDGFSTLTEQNQRVKKNLGDSMYLCHHCTTVCESRSLLQKHLKRHLGDQSYQCTICSARFAQQLYLIRHQENHHAKSKPLEMYEHEDLGMYMYKRNLQCDLCPAKYVHEKTFARHKKSHEENPHLCKSCWIPFATLEQLETHEKIHYSCILYKCSLCPAFYSKKATLMFHMKSHLEESSFNCKENPAVMPSSARLPTSTNYQLRFPCLQCARVFPTKQELKFHKAIHSNWKSFECSTCKTAFKYELCLQQHELRKHQTGADIQCPKCSSAIFQDSPLKPREVVFKEERLFQCDLCPSAFKLEDRLMEHVKTHMGLIKPCSVKLVNVEHQNHIKSNPIQLNPCSVRLDRRNVRNPS